MTTNTTATAQIVESLNSIASGDLTKAVITIGDARVTVERNPNATVSVLTSDYSSVMTNVLICGTALSAKVCDDQVRLTVDSTSLYFTADDDKHISMTTEQTVVKTVRFPMEDE